MSGLESGYLPRRNRLELTLVPKGAAVSSDARAMGEALRRFVTEAKERALFSLDELPSEVVAVFRAYEFASELDSSTIASWFVSFDPDRKLVDETVAGLGLIGCGEMAALLREAGDAWAAGKSAGTDPAERAMDRFETTRAQEEPLIRRCSEWVRSSRRTVILGDGELDTVYKEVMKQLHRCNVQHSRRRLADNEHRRRLGLKPVEPPTGTHCSVGDLIAETQRRYPSD